MPSRSGGARAAADRARPRIAAAATLALLGAAPPARADGAGRRVHGSAGVGGALLLTGAGGDHLRLEAAADLKLGGRFGALVAWRALDADRRGLLTAGLVFEGAAARPRLVLDLHADLGVDLDGVAPLAGGGIRTTLQLAGPLGAIFDSGAYLVLDGIERTRLQLQSSVLVGVRW